MDHTLLLACHWIDDAKHRAFVDADLDGYASDRFSDGSDCDDEDPAIHPGAAELCNGVDDNCDGSTDESPIGNQCRSAAHGGSTDTSARDHTGCCRLGAPRDGLVAGSSASAVG